MSVPVEIEGVVTVVGKTVQIGPLRPPGIAVAAAYADLDNIGQLFSVAVPASGIIQSAVYHDLDDEGLQVDLWMFTEQPQTLGADNAALVLPDTDNLKVLDVIQFTGFRDGNTGQISSQNGLGIAYVAPASRLWFQLQARGALNIAAANLPQFKLTILAD